MQPLNFKQLKKIELTLVNDFGVERPNDLARVFLFKNMNIKKELISHAKDLQEIYELTDFEALQIASNLLQMDLYMHANVIVSNSNYPTALEKIAIHLKEISLK